MLHISGNLQCANMFRNFGVVADLTLGKALLLLNWGAGLFFWSIGMRGG